MIYFTPKHPQGVIVDKWFMYMWRKLNLPSGCLASYLGRIICK